MFGLKVETKLVRAKKTATETDVPEVKEHTDYLALATEAGKRLVLGIVITSAAIIGMTTLSQVTVNRLQAEKYEN